MIRAGVIRNLKSHRNQAVTLAFGPWQDLGPDGVRGSLEITRTAAATGSVRVTELDGNVLYRLAFPGPEQAQVTAAAPRASIPLVVTPLRCDPHAFAEVKKPFEFPVQVALGDAEPLAGTVPVTMPSGATTKCAGAHFTIALTGAGRQERR